MYYLNLISGLYMENTVGTPAFHERLVSCYVFILRGMNNQEAAKAMATKYQDFVRYNPTVIAYHRRQLAQNPQSQAAIEAQYQFTRQPASDSAEDFDRRVDRRLKKLGLWAIMLVGGAFTILTILLSNWFVGTFMVILAVGALRLAFEQSPPH